MTENIDNLLLENLVKLRNDLKEFRDETREDLAIIKQRLNSIERGFAGTHDDNVTIQMRIDRVDNRLDKVERRLELTN